MNHKPDRTALWCNALIILHIVAMWGIVIHAIIKELMQ